MVVFVLLESLVESYVYYELIFIVELHVKTFGVMFIRIFYIFFQVILLHC